MSRLYQHLIGSDGIEIDGGTIGLGNNLTLGDGTSDSLCHTYDGLTHDGKWCWDGSAGGGFKASQDAQEYFTAQLTTNFGYITLTDGTYTAGLAASIDQTLLWAQEAASSIIFNIGGTSGGFKVAAISSSLFTSEVDFKIDNASPNITMDGGTAVIQTPNATGAISHPIIIGTGQTSGVFDSGDFTFATGNAIDGNTGSISLLTGNATTLASGDLTIGTGQGNSAVGSVFIQVDGSVDVTYTSNDMAVDDGYTITMGTGGDVEMYYDVTLGGLILDPEAGGGTHPVQIGGGVANGSANILFYRAGIYGSATSSNAAVNFAGAESFRSALSFVNDYNGSSVVANVLSTVTYAGSASSPLCLSSQHTVITETDHSGTGNYKAGLFKCQIAGSMTTGAIRNLRNLELEWAGDSGTHTNGDVRRIGLYCKTFAAISGSPSADYVASMSLREDVCLWEDVSLYFDTASVSASGDTTVLYDSGSAELRCSVDGQQTWVGDGTSFIVDSGARCIGDRIRFAAGDNGNITADRYLELYNGQIMTATRGFTVWAAGSVDAVTINFNASVVTTPGDVIFEVHVGGVATATDTVTISTTGDKKQSATFTVGTHTFATDDVISLYVNFNGFVGTINDTQMSAILKVDG